MQTTNVEKIFQLITESSTIIREEVKCTDLEALAETGENWFHDDVLQEEISEFAKKKLMKMFKEYPLSSFEQEEIRKGWQLAVLKAMRQYVQANHQMTPDAVGFLFAYLVEKLTAKQEDIAILDLAVGTGNLLYTILNSLKEKRISSSTGIEVDESLIRIAYTGANLCGHPVQLLHQDSLQPLYVNPADVIICDLPVGYYPNVQAAEQYELKAKEGMSFAHHLFIEQSFTYAKEGAYLFFLIPSQLFQTEEAASLNRFIHEKGYIQGLIQLPESMFNAKQSAKSILILQKKGNGNKAPEQVLLVNMPKLSDQTATAAVLAKMEGWIKKSLE